MVSPATRISTRKDLILIVNLPRRDDIHLVIAGLHLPLGLGRGLRLHHGRGNRPVASGLFIRELHLVRTDRGDPGRLCTAGPRMPRRNSASDKKNLTQLRLQQEQVTYRS